MRVVLALSLCCVAAVAGAGCGGDARGGDEDRIRAIIAEVAEDPAAICAHLPAEVVSAVGGLDQCDALAVHGDGGRADDLAVDAVRVDGDVAIATVTAAGGSEEEIAFVREGGDWKVDEAAGD